MQRATLLILRIITKERLYSTFIIISYYYKRGIQTFLRFSVANDVLIILHASYTAKLKAPVCTKTLCCTIVGLRTGGHYVGRVYSSNKQQSGVCPSV